MVRPLRLTTGVFLVMAWPPCYIVLIKLMKNGG